MTNIEENFRGKVFCCSWGYNMTHTEFCRVVQDKGKTVKAVMLARKFVTGNEMVGTVIPIEGQAESYPFRLNKKIGSDGDAYLKGKLPNHSTAEIWFEWDGTPQYWNTMD